MSRSIVTISSKQDSSLLDITNVVDDYKDKIIKLIPGEVVTAYLGIKGLMDSAKEWIKNIEITEWVIFGILLILTPLLYRKIYQVKGKQLLVSTIAFAIWVFSIGGPFDYFFLLADGNISPVKGFYSGVTLILFTLITPLLFSSEDTSV